MRQRIVSLILIISLILSLFTIYSFASEAETVSDTADTYAKTHLHHKNSFGDDADDTGAAPGLINATNSSFDIKAESNGNKYGYYTFNDASSNVYFQFAPSSSYTIGTDRLGYMIFEMDFNDFGSLITTKKFFEIHSGTGSLSSSERIAASDILNISNNGINNYIYLNNNKLNRISISKDQWVHIRIELSILSSDATKYNFKCYVDDKSFETTFNLGTPGVITYIRMGSSNSQNLSFGLDNVALYSAPENIASYKDLASVKGALMMKVGAENASMNGSQIELTNPPMLINGEIYCPTYILESFSEKQCPSEYVTNIDNVEYTHINNVNAALGIDAQAYDMGLILIGNKDAFLPDNATYDEIAEVMKAFVFNIPSPNDFKQIVRTNTNDFDHPYMLVNQDRFNELKTIYESGSKGTLTDSEDKILYGYISRYLDSAKNYLSSYCGISPSGTYTGIKSSMIPTNGNYSKYSNNGYDNGGRVTIPTTPLLYFAFAYQMTGNLNYARAAYDFTLALGAWNHWGPDHFLNCADTAAPVAISYDWLYDAYVMLNQNGEKSKYSGQTYDKTEISKILFTHVIIPGYVQSNNITCPWPGSANSRYSNKTSNWNAVCSSGAIAAALVILEDEISTQGMTFETQVKLSSTSFKSMTTPIESIGNQAIHVGLSTYSDYAAKLSSMNLNTLAKYGLDQYVPDGSYVESPGYWSYGTNTLFRLIASLLSAAGDDFGFMDAWGIDTTCYFAIQSESSDYNTWNFNDGGVGKQDSSFFFFVGSYYGDDELIKVRKKHLSSGKGYSIYDILYYDQSVYGEPELVYDYHMVGIDAYSVRSSWDKGAIYAGLIGGPNTVSHGHMDAGSFVYHNNGKIWFHDIGADNYNIRYTNQLGYSRGYFSNYELYRIGAEGHNLIAITSEQDSLPFGQLKNADPKIIKTQSSTEGAYAVLDMSESYGTHVVAAKRGMLFTESRSTVIIQDEYVFNGAKTAYWFGHYNLTSGYVDEVVLSADGRTAFMISGDDMIRVSIVSDNDSLRFEIMDCYTYLLDITHSTDRSTTGGAATETNRDSLRKLAIKCENVEALNLAVVIEEVNDFSTGTAYEWTAIDDWTISSKDNTIIEDKFKAEFESSTPEIGSISFNYDKSSYILNYAGTSDKYLGILPGAAQDGACGSSLILHPKQNASIKLSDHRYVTVDLDLFAESSLIPNSEFGMNVLSSDGNTIFISMLKFENRNILSENAKTSLLKGWRHVTLILDVKSSLVSVFINNAYIDQFSIEGISEIESFAFRLPAPESMDASLFLDNIIVRSFAGNYTSDTLPKVLTDKLSLSSWGDRIEYVVKSLPLAMANGSFVYTNEEIESAIQKGQDVVLLRDTVGIIDVASPCRIDTRGYNFNYNSDSYIAESSGNFITFKSGEITVRWHINGTVIEESYTSSTIATFKQTNSAVGAYRYTSFTYADGGIGYNVTTTGWSDSPSGEPLSPIEMTVSKDNCDFWLVDNADPNCLFVVITQSGQVKAYNNEQSLRDYLSGTLSAKEIILCRDVEIKNTSPLSLARSGITVYLNGHTLSHRQLDVHTFIYSSGTSQNISFIGPGTIEGDTSRTLFTSSSSTSDVTSKYGVVIKNARIITNTQIADLRIGQHKFIDCDIYQTNSGSKHLIDLWNKNTSMSNGIPTNLLTVTFDGCRIKSDVSGSSVLFSFTSTTYAEIYITDTLIVTIATLMASTNPDVKFTVNGISAISAGKLTSDENVSYNNIVLENGVKTSFEVSSAYIPSGSKLTNSYDEPFSYLISDNYALVIWNKINGEKITEEYVSVGVTPKATSASVADYLRSIGEEYTYNIRMIESTSTVNLSPIYKTSVSLMYSMSIENDLAMYIYIAKTVLDNKIKAMTINGVSIKPASFELISVNGKSYYRYRISTFAPATASNSIPIIIEQNDGKSLRYNISAVDYLESLLAISSDDNEKTLAVKLLKYIRSAHIYFSPSRFYEIERLDDLIEEYKSYDLMYGALKQEHVPTGSMKEAIKSARLNLSFTARIRFTLNPDYSGSLKVIFNGVETVYSVKNGSVNGKDYIEVVMPAGSVNECVIISSGSNSISYSIHAYATSLNNTDKSLQDMLLCLADYSAAAKMYIEAQA